MWKISRFCICMQRGRVSCQNTCRPIFYCCQWLEFVFVNMSTNPQLGWYNCRVTLLGTNWSITFLYEKNTLLSLVTFFYPYPSEPILFWVQSMCLENIYFDLFYGSLNALQLWAVMCLTDDKKEWGKQRESSSVRVCVMHLFDNDDPLVLKCVCVCVSQSQWQGEAFDTLRTIFGPCLLQLSSCCLWL